MEQVAAVVRSRRQRGLWLRLHCGRAGYGRRGAGGGVDAWAGGVYTEGMTMTTLARKHPSTLLARIVRALEFGARVIENGAANVDGNRTAYRG